MPITNEAPELRLICSAKSNTKLGISVLQIYSIIHRDTDTTSELYAKVNAQSNQENYAITSRSYVTRSARMWNKIERTTLIGWNLTIAPTNHWKIGGTDRERNVD